MAKMGLALNANERTFLETEIHTAIPTRKIYRIKQKKNK